MRGSHAQLLITCSALVVVAACTSGCHKKEAAASAEPKPATV
ncbi:MAG: hypothetical protein K0S65_6176, partial [Labilithrix sp.]|nr:hypothetical protein [Labilithrix sp.]